MLPLETHLRIAWTRQPQAIEFEDALEVMVCNSLDAVLDAYVADSNTIHVVWPSSRKMTPKVRVFVDFVHAHFGKHLVTETDDRKRQRVRRST